MVCYNPEMEQKLHLNLIKTINTYLIINIYGVKMLGFFISQKTIDLIQPIILNLSSLYRWIFEVILSYSKLKKCYIQ